ncbi:hypothetical protein GWI33_013922 [Rhynchophorus ferrugineus]|uniref:Uncharacterized protein n=1 Tax=Rhynchophorus ferrugineus TaxID=354439 RepID=A0A834I8F2_RHYFE|nr:hypothetical protein GWI33_013922 [Rhynchophorus ferrugineus]
MKEYKTSPKLEFNEVEGELEGPSQLALLREILIIFQGVSSSRCREEARGERENARLVSTSKIPIFLAQTPDYLPRRNCRSVDGVPVIYEVRVGSPPGGPVPGKGGAPGYSRGLALLIYAPFLADF